MSPKVPAAEPKQPLNFHQIGRLLAYEYTLQTLRSAIAHHTTQLTLDPASELIAGQLGAFKDILNSLERNE